MSNDRHETLFALRCGARLLHRQSRLMRRIDMLCKFVSFIAGTAAFAAIVTQRPVLTVVIGLVLAVAQAVEFVVRPGEKALLNDRCARLYELPATREGSLTDKQLADELAKARECDETGEIESLRRPVWNDVSLEMRGETAKLLKLTLWQRLVSAVA